MPNHKKKYDTGVGAGSEKVAPDPPTYVPKANWLPFPGFSYLFDNPADPVSVENGYAKICVDVCQSENLRLYQSIKCATERMNLKGLASEFHFFALPSNTYHVTVWDGVNKDNFSELNPSAKKNFELCFKQNIESILPNWPPLGNILDYTKWFDGKRSIRLRYESLRSRQNTVLVVYLEPADDDSDQELKKIMSKRAELDDRFSQIGKHENFPYQPHVAVGYFSNSKRGEDAILQNMDKWIALFNEEVSEGVIEFNTINLYAFTDMVTYIKPIPSGD